MFQAAAEAEEYLAGTEAFLWLFIGIVMSVLVPVVVRWLRPQGAGLEAMSAGRRLLAIATPYIKVAVASAVLALLFVFVYDFESSRLAFLAGYAWDSTLQKITKPDPGT
jgi:hypothetical protein